MKVSVDISAEYKEPYAVIYTDKITDEIQRMIVKAVFFHGITLVPLCFCRVGL